jgi:GcrA cell cycle regulator
MTPNPWNDFDTAELKRMWEVEGKTASQIGAVLGRTRNAIIGKSHRENLVTRMTPERAGGPKPRPRKPRPSRAKSPRLRSPRPQPRFKVIESPRRPRSTMPAHPTIGKPLMALEDNDCRWPYSDPDKPNFHFCGLRTHPGSSYCEAHTANAYTPIAEYRAMKRAVA